MQTKNGTKKPFPQPKPAPAAAPNRAVNGNGNGKRGASGLNQVTLLGNLGADPELRALPSGTGVLKLRLAVTERFLKDEEWQERTEWVNVSMFGKRGEGLSRILGRGDRVCVVGGLRTNVTENENGEKRYFTEVVARDLVLAGRAKSNSGSTPPESSQGGVEDEIPF